MVEYLMLRRHEKDYILREDDKYVNQAKGVADKIGTVLTGTHADQAVKDNKRFHLSRIRHEE